MDALSAVATTPAPALREKSSSSPDVSRDKRTKKTREEKQEFDEKGLRESRRTPFASQGAVKATEFDSNITFKEIIDLKREEDVPRALRVWLEKNDITRKGSDGWTPLHEACNAHNIPLVVELLRLKALGTARSNDGNIPLHYLVKAPPPKGAMDSMATAYSYAKHSPKSALDAENDRGETPLYRAAQVGNYVIVSLLLQHGADPFLAFIPDDRLPTQREHWLRTQEAISAMKALAIKRRQEGAINKNKNSRVSSLFGRTVSPNSPVVSNVRKMTTGPELLRQSYLDAMKSPSGSKRSLSSPMDQMLMAIVTDAFATRTLEIVHKLFYSAWKASDTWAPMQAIQLSIDRITALKEERGRYYIGFAHNNEVLAAQRDSFTLVNCSDTPLRWEIFRYYPELSTYNADTLRFEVVGKRRGLLSPGTSEKIQVSLLATSACEFAQLVGIQYFEDVPGSEPRAAYFFLASSMKPPKDLEELEVDSALLPSLDHCLGVGGSASVYKVGNFLPAQTDATHLAVKKFQYNLGGGLEEHSEDYRRFKLELYISSKMNHPNVVRTYGFTGHPPCLIMEYVERNLRDLIDDKSTPLSLPIQMKVALHIAKGMTYLHSFNVIHRDLKPANILINGAYDAKVADFGISLADKILDAKLRSNTKQEEVQGTQFYMAPELILGDKNYSIESDVYSYGLILYEVLKRTNLVDDLALGDISRVDFMRMRATGAQPVARIEGLDSTMKDLIENCWATKPQARYPFTSVVAILTEYRKRCLHLDLDQEFEEAAAEGQVHAVLDSWNKRMFAADEKVAQEFRDRFLESKAFKRLLSSLLDAKWCSDEEAMEIAALFEHTIGPDAGELVANLRALIPVLAGLGDQAAPAQAYLLAALHRSLTARVDAVVDEEGLNAWLELVAAVHKDPRLFEFVTTKRFVAERQSLERRLAELKADTKKVKRRLQRLQEAPNSLEYVSGFLHLNLRECPAADALFEKLHNDVSYLEKQLSNTFEPSEIRKLRQRDNREARIAIALYDSHALAVRHAQDQLTALATVLRDDSRLPSLRARLHVLLQTVSAAQTAPLPGCD